MRVFFSHPSHLKPLVRNVSSGLPKFLGRWLDEESLCWGDNLDRSIRLAIRTDSDFVLILLDKTALNSDWVRRELEWALERENEINRIFLLPIVVGDIPSDSLPDTIRHRAYLRLANYEQASVSTLASQISEHLFQLVARSFDLQNAGDHDKPNYEDLVAQLADRIVGDGFPPDIIIAIARGGLVAAGYLSKQMGRLLSKQPEQPRLIPVVSLWPHTGFDNSFNNFTFTQKDFDIDKTDKVRVLIVDGICRSGRTLVGARTHLEQCIDASTCVIRTATISYYEGLYAGATSPNYFVDKPRTPIKDFGGDVEPM